MGCSAYEVDRAERVHLGYLVALKGLADRDAADKLRGLEVQARRDDLPPPGADEVYAVDLIGCAVFDQHGTARGVVQELEEAGAQDLLVLEKGVLVPLGLVKEVDTDARRIVIEAPEGLFEV
jgi:16S rRNA processing protein RimM